MSVTISVSTPGSGTVNLERPARIGGYTVFGGPQDFDDLWLSLRFSDRLGAQSFAPDGYVIQPGDMLEFDIQIPPAIAGNVPPPPPNNTSNGPLSEFLYGGHGPSGSGSYTDNTSPDHAWMGLELKFLAGPWTSEPNLELLDLNSGLAIGPASNKLLIADSAWYHMRADLSFYVGLMLDGYAATCDENGIHRFRLLLRNIFITRSGAIAHAIFSGAINEVQSIPIAGNLGIYGGWQLRAGIYGDLTVFGAFTADDVIGPYVSPSVTILTGTTYTVPIEVGTVYNNSGTGNMTATLYLAGAVLAGRRITFINLHATKTLTISRAGSDLIDGATTKGPYGQYAGITLESDGSAAFHVVP